jgi:glycosyltransferase involved in cell wall biosynthesis/Flp pilus assembly protein TadD
MSQRKPSLALVIGNLPTVQEIDQFQLIAENFDVKVISSESICGYLAENSYYQDLTCLALPDQDDHATFLPGLEKILVNFDYVIVKERLGLYAYQAVKAKWQHRFKLISWVDNLTPMPADDVRQMRTIRSEITDAADAFIVQSKAAKATLVLEGVDESKIFFMQPWVEATVKRDKARRAQALEALGLAENSFIIGYFGPIEWEEGLSDLVASIKLIGQENPKLKDRIRVIFSGIGSYSSELRQLFIQLGVDQHAIYVVPNRQSSEAILAAADAIYVSSQPSRDRIDGDPFRILTAMANGVPVLASRSPVVEELCGKHRIDFCAGNPLSLAKAIIKMSKAQALNNDIVAKNLADIEKTFSTAKSKEKMLATLDQVVKTPRIGDKTGVDQQIKEIETRIRGKQYLAAVEIIENVFRKPELPVHHKGNLYRLVGDCFAKLGDLEGAKDAYMKAMDVDPYSAKIYIGLGTIALLKQGFDIAVLHFQKAVSLAPEDELANLGLGIAFQGMGEFKESSSWVGKSLEINPVNTSALFTLVKNSHEVGDYEQVEAALKRYLTVHPQDHNMIYTLGGIQYKRGRFDEVTELMNSILNIDPLNARASELAKIASQEVEKAKVSSSRS